MTINKNKAIIFKQPRGFTLIELLIAIAVLSILAVATLFIIDPIDKIKAGNDAKVQQDVISIAKAAESYAAVNNGEYPTGILDAVTQALIAAGDLRSAPKEPTGYTPYEWLGGGTSAFTVSGQLNSKKFKNTQYFKYTSSTGKSCAAISVSNDCP